MNKPYTEGKWQVEKNPFDKDWTKSITCLTERNGQKIKVIIASDVSDTDLAIFLHARELYEVAVMAQSCEKFPIDAAAKQLVEEIKSFQNEEADAFEK